MSKPELKALCYCRYSPQFGAIDSNSADAQLEQCKAYCAFQGWPIIGKFKDEQLSGKAADNRPGFQEAIKLACANKAVFVCYSLSRFSRKMSDTILYAERLNKAGAQLACIKEAINTASPTGRIQFHILSALNEYNRETIAETTRDAMLAYQDKMNLKMSDRVPFGKMVDPADPKRLVPESRELTVIARAVELHKAGHGLRVISRKLFAEGFYGRRSPLHRNGNRKAQVIASRIGLIDHHLVKKMLMREGVL